MTFTKYSAIYRNDSLIIGDEYVIGKVKDVKEYLKYELAGQCMSDLSYEELIFNGRLVFDLLEELDQTEKDDTRIKAFYNPMGAFQYTAFINEEDEKNE